VCEVGLKNDEQQQARASATRIWSWQRLPEGSIHVSTLCRCTSPPNDSTQIEN
jgi:hypothetical protein